VAARRRSFCAHGLGRLAQSDKSADSGLLPLDHAFQVADVVHAHVAALHLHDHLLGLAAFAAVRLSLTPPSEGRGVEKVDVAVDAGVRALLVVLGAPRA